MGCARRFLQRACFAIGVFLLVGGFGLTRFVVTQQEHVVGSSADVVRAKIQLWFTHLEGDEGKIAIGSRTLTLPPGRILYLDGVLMMAGGSGVVVLGFPRLRRRPAPPGQTGPVGG
jgi:hypothetical protein